MMPIRRPKNIEPNPTKTFGIPRGTLGRAGYQIQGIVFHCLGTSLERYAAMVCADNRANKAKPKHASVHYAVGYNGEIMQFVDDENISWGFAEYLSNFVTTGAVPSLNWPVLTAANPLVTPDYYVINIGIESGFHTGHLGDDCECDAGQVSDLSETGYARLVHLAAFLADEYGIALDDDFVTYHQLIDANAEDECKCSDLPKLLEDIGNYCNPCENTFPTAVEGDLVKVLGAVVSDCGGAADCLAWQDVDSFIPEETPFIGQDSNTIDFVPGGPYGHEPTAHVKISNDECNIITAEDDGLYATRPVVQGIDTNSVDMEIEQTGCRDLTTISANVRVDPSVSNDLTITPNGLFVDVQASETDLTITDTSTVDLTTSGTNGHHLTADVKISDIDNNAITIEADGLAVVVSEWETEITPVDTQTVDMVSSGASGHTISAHVKISTEPSNIIDVRPDGLYAVNDPPPAIAPVDTATIDLSVTGAEGHTIQADVRVSPNAGNTITALANGLYAAGSSETPITVVDTGSVNLTATGTANHTLSANVILSNKPDNILYFESDGGVYSPPPLSYPVVRAEHDYGQGMPLSLANPTTTTTTTSITFTTAFAPAVVVIQYDWAGVLAEVLPYRSHLKAELYTNTHTPATIAPANYALAAETRMGNGLVGLYRYPIGLSNANLQQMVTPSVSRTHIVTLPVVGAYTIQTRVVTMIEFDTSVAIGSAVPTSFSQVTILPVRIVATVWEPHS